MHCNCFICTALYCYLFFKTQLLIYLKTFATDISVQMTKLVKFITSTCRTEMLKPVLFANVNLALKRESAISNTFLFNTYNL